MTVLDTLIVFVFESELAHVLLTKDESRQVEALNLFHEYVCSNFQMLDENREGFELPFF